ncbi:hypothetical protein Cyrtocomes_00506 [Candidatus Cyrtobacter comes]|uniref:Uncharacterized protein n=1 Tax=Candidatus Cyrtobacter comes TaxID=675776 RepID=A0ABU5L7N0_9RICK|nr:hypothetical protein [Candidatus Cyrtobacter comes]MDZ5762136.1 hypothetical protein [Candidatus Cyrtobacter comes]
MSLFHNIKHTMMSPLYNISYTCLNAGTYLKEGALVFLIPAAVLAYKVDGDWMAAIPFGALIKLLTQPIALCLFDGIDKIFDTTTELGLCRAELCKSFVIRPLQYSLPTIAACIKLYKDYCMKANVLTFQFKATAVAAAAGLVIGFCMIESVRLEHILDHLDHLDHLSATIFDSIIKADCHTCNSNAASPDIEDIDNRAHNHMQSGDTDCATNLENFN